MGFSRQEHWNGLACPLPGDLPNPGIKPRSPTLQADSLPSELPGKPKNTGVGSLSLLRENFPIIMYLYGYVLCALSHLSRVRLFATPWIAAHQASLSITNSRRLLRLMSIKSVMPSSHLILCRLLLLLPPIPPSIRVFSSESALHMRWPQYWSFSFSISPSNEHPGLTSFRMDWLNLLAVQGTLKSLLQHHSSKASIFWRSAFFLQVISSINNYWLVL